MIGNMLENDKEMFPCVCLCFRREPGEYRKCLLSFAGPVSTPTLDSLTCTNLLELQSSSDNMKKIIRV